MLSLVLRLEHLALFLYKPPPTAIPADGPCPSLLVRRAPVLQHPVLLTLGNGHKWRKDLNPPSQQKILLSAKWPKKSQTPGLCSDTSLLLFLIIKMRNKRKKPTFSTIGLTRFARMKKKMKKFLQAAFYLFLSPRIIFCPAAAASNFSSTAARLGTGRIPAVHTGEHRPCCHKSGATLSQGYNSTSNAYFSDEVPLKRRKKSEPWSWALPVTLGRITNNWTWGHPGNKAVC